MALEISASVAACLSDEGVTTLQGLGVKTDADLACIWAAESEVIAVVDSSIAVEMVRAWKLANMSYVRALESTSLARPVIAQSHTPCCPETRPKKRAMPPVLLQAKSCSLRLPGVVAVRKQPPEFSRRSQQIQSMFQVVLATGSSNLRFSPRELELHAEALLLFHRLLEKVSDARLTALMSAMRRWIRYKDCWGPAECVCWKPSSLTLSAFLHEVAKGGPTASVNVFQALKWWGSTLGIPFPITDPLVAMWASPPEGHASRQRTPLALCIFLTLCSRFLAATGSVRAFMAWVLLFLTACLRFAHLQRSCQLSCDGQILHALCRRGKRKEQGVQQPFRWGSPACVAPGVDISAVLLLEYGELSVSLPDAEFIVPDLNLPSTGRLEPGTPKIARPMSRPKFCDLRRCLFPASGVPESETVSLSSYSFRRFMPTLLDCQGAPWESRLAVGNWTEGVSEGKKDRFSTGSRMPIRYSEVKSTTAGMAKLRALVQLNLAVQKLKPRAQSGPTSP